MSACSGGEIGIRAGLKILFLRERGFDPHPEHHHEMVRVRVICARLKPLSHLRLALALVHWYNRPTYKPNPMEALLKKAVKELYGVEPEEVNTMNYAGKNKSRYSKSGIISGKTNSYKKAIVTLAKGETIDFYSNI